MAHSKQGTLRIPSFRRAAGTPGRKQCYLPFAGASSRFAGTVSRRNVGPLPPVELHGAENFSRRLQPFAKPPHLNDKRAMNGTKQKRS
jgi:hypothetical protein